jgi:hypothetical protein
MLPKDDGPDHTQGHLHIAIHDFCTIKTHYFSKYCILNYNENVNEIICSVRIVQSILLGALLERIS